MFSNLRSNPFVCLDEITEVPLELNPVIYNPGKDNMAFRSELLYKSIYNYYGIKLSSEQLMHLTKYDVHELDTFKKELKEIIRKEKDKKINRRGI